MKKYTYGLLLLTAANIFFGVCDMTGPLSYLYGSNVYAASFLNRLFSAFLLLSVLCIRRKSLKISAGAILPAILLGVLFALTLLTLNLSIALVGAGMGTMLHMFHTLVTSFAEARLRGTRVRRVTLVSLAVVLSGIFCMMGGVSGTASLFGTALGLFSGITYACIMLTMGYTAVQEESPMVVAFYNALFSGMILLAVGALSGRMRLEGLQPQAWMLHILGAILGGFIGLVFLQIGINRASAAAASILGALEPLTSTLLGIMLLGEETAPLKLAGCAMILTGVVLEPLTDLKKDRHVT